jgi:hypothetical protein
VAEVVGVLPVVPAAAWPGVLPPGVATRPCFFIKRYSSFWVLNWKCNA